MHVAVISTKERLCELIQRKSECGGSLELPGGLESAGDVVNEALCGAVSDPKLTCDASKSKDTSRLVLIDVKIRVQQLGAQWPNFDSLKRDEWWRVVGQTKNLLSSIASTARKPTKTVD